MEENMFNHFSSQFEQLGPLLSRIFPWITTTNREVPRERQLTEIILENVSDVVVLLSVEGRIQLTNLRFQELLGYSTTELLKKNLSQIICVGQREMFFQALAKAVSSCSLQHIEVKVHQKDGRTFPASLVLAAFEDNHETIVVSTLRDISAQHLIENLSAAVVNQRALTEFKTQFISTISHEYRTPLTVMKMYTDLLKQRHQHLSVEQSQAYLDIIQTQIGRMTDLSNSILEFNRQETRTIQFSPELISITDLCKEIVNDYCQINPQYHIVFHVSGTSQQIRGDEQLLRQIISNLLSNAIKYSPPSKVIETTLCFSDREVVLSVKDEGIGIPEEDLANLFDIFYRSNNANQIQGTGVGLAIVKQAVDAHGGTVSVSSSVGHGSEFLVVLPLSGEDNQE
jgi:PAS domain S-box-containing protein